MRSLLPFAALLGVFAVASAAHAADITYTVHDVFGSDSVTGTITTDGNSGVLGTADITGFNITLKEGAATDSVTSANGQEIIIGSSVTATATGLFFDFDNPNFDTLIFQKPFVGAEGENALCYQGANGGCVGPVSTELFVEGDAGNFQSQVLSGVQEIASVTPAVPEPSSFVLLGTSLIGFAGAARRKFLKA